jgi:pimeloyl-ACP methyl ester carboxylesterase
VSFLKRAGNISGIKNVPVLSKLLRSKDYEHAQGIKKEIFLKTVTFDYSKALKTISNPALIIWGSNDAETSLNWAKEVNRILKNSQLYVIPNTTHFTHLEKPMLFASKVKEFLQKE